MADSLQNKKRPREEEEENLVRRLTTPNMAADPQISVSLEVPASHDEKQPQQQPHSSPIARIHPLRLRELGKIRSLPNIYKDYHVHTFPSIKIGTIDTISINFMVIGVDIILVVHSYSHVVLFKRQRDEISPVCWKNDSNPITFLIGHVKSVCYNYHDNSFLIAYVVYQNPIYGKYNVDIISLEIAPIQAGGNPMVKRVFPGSCRILKWGFDVPICRAMIYDLVDHQYKFFELKEYTVLFTIPERIHGRPILVGSGGTLIHSSLKCVSPGNMEMVMYDEMPSTERNGRLGIELRIYSKLNGTLQKVAFVPRPSQKIIEFVVLCGSNTLLLQQHSSRIEVVKICDENPPDSINITHTNIRAQYEPYYLHKRAQFICYTELRRIHVCNLDGDILVTLEDHPVYTESPDVSCRSFLGHSHISNSQDVLISLCRSCWLHAPTGERWIYSVNVSSLVTGECLAKISSEDPNCSKIRKEVLTDAVTAFAYDERTHQFFTGNGTGLCGIWSNRFHNDAGIVSS